MTRTIETTEKTKLPYDVTFLDQKADILLGLVSTKVPVLGLWISQSLVTNKEYMRKVCAKYYTEMHSFTFNSLKSVIRSKMTQEDFPISYETMESLVTDLEREYGSALPEMGIEPESVLAPFISNQLKWYNNNFKFKETA